MGILSNLPFKLILYYSVCLKSWDHTMRIKVLGRKDFEYIWIANYNQDIIVKELYERLSVINTNIPNDSFHVFLLFSGEEV